MDRCFDAAGIARPFSWIAVPGLKPGYRLGTRSVLGGEKRQAALLVSKVSEEVVLETEAGLVFFHRIARFLPEQQHFVLGAQSECLRPRCQNWQIFLQCR